MSPLDLLSKSINEGWHLGAQLCVWHEGEIVIDLAVGEARPGIPMRRDSIIQWYSSGKPLTAVLLAMLAEQGALNLAQPVATVIPEFAQNGKEEITFWHLLTHTAGFRAADRVPPGVPWPQMIQKICEAAREPDWPLGEKAGYSPAASWFLLAETVQRITHRSFDEYIKTELLDPLGMSDTWLRLPFAKYREYGERIAWMYNTDADKKEPLPLQDAEGMGICRPGASARGPVYDLVKFYAMLLRDGQAHGRHFLKRETIAELTRRHRLGLFDHTFMHTMDFGLGFILDSNRYGPNTVPYGYGFHCSDDAFGHSGAQSSCAFADPKHDLAVAWVANGQPGERNHQVRQRALNSAIYEYLDLAGARRA